MRRSEINESGAPLDEVALAYRTAFWWREQHAKPLSNVAANLRYHVEREHAQVKGRTEVAQRLNRDYVQQPKNSGYRAIHLIVRRDNRLIEVQLRTFRQDAWANQVEEDGRIQLTAFKFGEGDVELHDYYRAVSSAFATLDHGDPLSGTIKDELVETFRKVRPILGR